MTPTQPSTPLMPLVEVTRRAFEVLTRELGAADTLRFVNQFSTGAGDYTAERAELFAGRSLSDIVADIRTEPTPKPKLGE
ncbi:MAG: hypothetical protein ACRC7O_10250 [Fimbriiglobus sp.]